MNELLHYEIVEAPNDDWIVFVHGAGGSIKTWKYQKAALKGMANLLLLDLRDHGESKNIEPSKSSYTFDLVGEDVLKLLDHLKIKKAFFISLSMGSMIVQKLALMRPNLIQGAVVAGGIYKVNKRMMVFVQLARFFSALLPFRTMYWMFSWLIMPRKNHQFSRKVFIEQSQKLNAAEYHKWMSLYKEFRRVLSEFYHEQLTFPLLAVMGSQDYVFLDAASNYARQHDRAQLHVMEACGHICNVEQPSLFNTIAINFYEKQKLK